MPYRTVWAQPGADSVPYGILGENGEKDPPLRPPAGSAPVARGIPPDVTLDSSYSELAQAASLVNQLNGSLSHSPSQPAGLSSELYQLGKKGAGSSNVAWPAQNMPVELFSSTDAWSLSTTTSSPCPPTEP